MSFVLLGILNSQVSGAAGIDPATLNPDLWLDASDASTITESGGSVSQWDNKGTLQNLTQAVSASQPTTGVSTQNGLNVIDFASDFMEGTTRSQWTFLHDGTTYFICSVFKYDTSTDAKALIGSGTGSVFQTGVLIQNDNRSSVNETRYTVFNSAGAGNLPIFLNPDPGLDNPGSFQISSGLLDPDNASRLDRLFYFVNDTEGTNENEQSGTPDTGESDGNFQVGANGSDGIALSGSIAELVIVSGANATEENRLGIVEYLNNKWGVF